MKHEEMTTNWQSVTVCSYGAATSYREAAVVTSAKAPFGGRTCCCCGCCCCWATNETNCLPQSSTSTLPGDHTPAAVG